MDMEEIRVNNYYSTHSIAKYEDEEDQDSKPIINKRTMRTRELLEKLKTNVHIKQDYKVDHLFPPNCRYYEQHSKGCLIVIEEPPAFRTIAVEKDMSNELQSLKSSGKLKEYGYENWAKENETKGDSKKPYMFNLAMPYVIFFLGFNENFDPLGGYVFFRTKPISGFSDPLCKAPLLNINENQTVCFGDRFFQGPKRSIFADTSHTIGSFWSTIFNTDYIYNYNAYQEVAGVCDYLTWEYYSHADPMFIYNVDWIKYETFNVGHTIEAVRKWLFNQEQEYRNEFSYKTLADLFSKQVQQGSAEVPGLKGIREPLIYDVSQYMFLDRNLHISVGDSFKMNDGRYIFVDSFLGFRKMIEPAFINFQREDGRIFKWKLNKKIKQYIIEKLKDERFEKEVTLPNGVVLRAGDILVMKNSYDQDVYRKIHYLRKAVDGCVEGRFGAEFYVIDNLPNDCSIMDLSNPEYMGIQLETDKEYFVLRGNRYPPGPALPVSYCNFREVTTSSRGNLVIKLIESQGSNKGYTYNVNLAKHTDQRIFEIENLRELPDIFRVGKNIMWAKYGTRDDEGAQGKAYVLPNLGVATPYNTHLKEAGYSRYSKKLIKDDVFSIAGWDMDIEFKIGDKVVVANWRNPLDMLTVKQIEGFVQNSENGNISFVMKDKNDKLYEHVYVDSRRSKIQVGTVRKITNNFGDLAAGMKIVATEAGISMFPKKDINIIVGFLYDTGGPEPLVLCSNACTLWYSDVIEKFDVIPISDEDWKEMRHASINPAKMRFQAGDIINGKGRYSSDHGYMAYRPRDSRTIRAQQVRYFHSFEESYIFDKDFTRDMIFDSFPNPRLTGRQEESLGFVNAFPNFHGMYTTTGKYYSAFLFANDPRSILNVPNSSK